MTNHYNTYAEFRAAAWERQGRDKFFDFHGSTPKGEWDYGCYLQPKRVLFYKDLWHCCDNKSARKLALEVFKFMDVNYLKMEKNYVYVDYNTPKGGTHILPGQETDKERHTG